MREPVEDREARPAWLWMRSRQYTDGMYIVALVAIAGSALVIAEAMMEVAQTLPESWIQWSLRVLVAIAFIAFGAYLVLVHLPQERRKPSFPIGCSPGGPTRSERTTGLVGLWLLAGFFLLLGLPWGVTIVQRALGAEGPSVLFELFFLPIPAVVLLVWAIVLTRRRHRW